MKTKKLTPAGVKNLIVKVLKDHKAIDIKTIKIKNISDVADYIVIATANSTVHVKALIGKARRELINHNIKPIGIEGENAQDWMLIDFGDVILHIMLEDTRKFYNLEKLWDIELTKKSE